IPESWGSEMRVLGAAVKLTFNKGCVEMEILSELLAGRRGQDAGIERLGALHLIRGGELRIAEVKRPAELPGEIGQGRGTGVGQERHRVGAAVSAAGRGKDAREAEVVGGELQAREDATGSELVGWIEGERAGQGGGRTVVVEHDRGRWHWGIGH